MEFIITRKDKKVPDLDSIGNRALKGLPGVAVGVLIEIFNTVLILEYFPKQLRSADIVMAHKADRLWNLPGSYRPIFREATLPLVSFRTCPKSRRALFYQGSVTALWTWIPSLRSSLASVPVSVSIFRYGGVGTHGAPDRVILD